MHGAVVPDLHHCFPPVVRDDTRLLILGSLPGARSLAAGRYYAHPQNQFWRLAGAVIGADLPHLPYDERLTVLLDHNIGLWDTVAAAERPGSLDAAIRLHEVSDLTGLASGLPMLRAIAFNGGTAAKIGRGRIGASSLTLIDLPSSSPAYTLPFADKLARWMVLRDQLCAR